jgi:hypothetical protein
LPNYFSHTLWYLQCLRPGHGRVSQFPLFAQQADYFAYKEGIALGADMNGLRQPWRCCNPCHYLDTVPGVFLAQTGEELSLTHWFAG